MDTTNPGIEFGKLISFQSAINLTVSSLLAEKKGVSHKIETLLLFCFVLFIYQDPKLITKVNLNLYSIQKRAADYAQRRAVKKDFQVAWLLRAIRCIDLTTLAGDDTPANVQKLCIKAASPIRPDLVNLLGLKPKGNRFYLWWI